MLELEFVRVIDSRFHQNVSIPSNPEPAETRD